VLLEPEHRPHAVAVVERGQSGRRERWPDPTRPQPARQEQHHRHHDGRDQHVDGDQRVHQLDTQRPCRPVQQRADQHPQEVGVTLDALADVEDGAVTLRQVLAVVDRDQRVVDDVVEVAVGEECRERRERERDERRGGELDAPCAGGRKEPQGSTS
jgi:hypothetical protein